MKISSTGKALGFVIAFCSSVLWPGIGAHAANPQELVFLTWSDYMDPALIDKFEARHNGGVRVKFAYFESDELRDELWLNTGGAGYDIICSNGRSIKAYARRGWLVPITERDVPNRRHIDPRWADAFPYAEEYAVPFLWGTVGIAYRTDLVESPITSWRQLLEPAPELQGKIMLVKDARDLMAMALKNLGQSINTTDLKALEQAEGLLMAQKPYVKGYSYVAVTEDSALVTGDAAAAFAYNGDALLLAEHDETIAYIVPEEGSGLWIDFLLVSQASKNKELAMDFINFLNEPENAAQLAQFVYYASPNRAAERLLPEEFLTDPVIYPDRALVDKSELYRELPPRVQKRYNTILPRLVGD